MFVVVGTFDHDQGKSSSIGRQIIFHLGCEGINGGNLSELDLDFSRMDSLLWMPHINNSEDKIISRIKAKNHKLLLISSKRCVETEYCESDVVGLLLKTRSNLGIMIEKEDLYRFKLLDPIGNIFCDTTDIEKLCNSLDRRVKFLLSLTRWSSSQVGEIRDFSISPEFLDIVRSYGDRFTTFVNAINPNRFLGNVATRCSHGFPAQRQGERIFVSRRNVDKQGMGEKDFVEVVLGVSSVSDQVYYYGVQKPSVDTPVQLLLFDYFPDVHYMVHGHVYVKDAPMTKSKIPCGYLEEFSEVTFLFPSPSSKNFAINLRGHGCLVMAEDLEFLKQIELQGRTFPEP